MNRAYPESVLVSYATKGKANAFPVGNSQQISLYNARAFNNSGAAINVGICRKHVNSYWKLWKMTGGAGTAFTDITSSIQTPAAVQVITAVNNDGFVVQSTRRFNLIGFTISTNQAGGVFTYKYWDGSAFQTLTTLEVPADYNTAADTWIVFRAPNDWVVGGTTGLTQTLYSMRMQATTAPGGVVSFSNMWIGEFLEFYAGVSNNSAVQLSFPDSKPFVCNGGEGLFPYFSTANAANQFGAYYSTI